MLNEMGTVLMKLNREQDVLYLEKFVVVGSWQEGKHQGALRRSANKELVFKVQHGADSV